jgi:hypothetical protein
VTIGSQADGRRLLSITTLKIGKLSGQWSGEGRRRALAGPGRAIAALITALVGVASFLRVELRHLTATQPMSHLRFIGHGIIAGIKITNKSDYYDTFDVTVWKGAS